jgi:hypothetical protein
MEKAWADNRGRNQRLDFALSGDRKPERISVLMLLGQIEGT